MAYSGKCMCGAVSYEIAAEKHQVGTCHCSMCRRWTGGIYISIGAEPHEITFKGADALTVFQSSDWAERAFCSKCGSSMYYRITAEGPYSGWYHMGAGTLDDYGDLKLTEQLFIDLKPGAYDFAQDTKNLTTPEVEALFAPQAL